MNLINSIAFGLFIVSSSRQKQKQSSRWLTKICGFQNNNNDDLPCYYYSTSLLSSIKDDDISNNNVSDNNNDESNSENKYEGLLQWLKSMDDAMISDKIILKPSNRGGGYGAYVTENVKKDELLFTIPRKACITYQNVINDKQCGNLFQQLIKKAGPGGNTVALAGYIAKERLNSIKKDNGDSFYTPYLATLPWERGINNQEHIIYWPDNEIEQLLTGTMCYDEAIALRQEVTLAIKVLDTIIGRTSQQQEEQNTGFRFPWQVTQQQLERKPVEGLSDAVKGAFVSILTRAFQDNEQDDNEKLVPLLDMLQHSETPNVSHSMRKEDGTVEVRAKTTLQPGDELLNQYRSELEESMPYHRFFTRFGFVPGIQEPIINLLHDKSSIFFAQKAEV